MRFLVENLKVRIYTPHGDQVHRIESQSFHAKSRATLRHVIGRSVLSLFGFKQSIYDGRGTAYLNSDYSITALPDQDLDHSVKYRYQHGIYYVKSTVGWTAIPDSDVTDEIRKACERR